MNVLLKNNFHNCECHLVSTVKGHNIYLSQGQANKAKKELCGQDDCQCGNFLGCRGPQDYDWAPTIDGGAVALLKADKR